MSVPVETAPHSHFDLRHLFKAFCTGPLPFCLKGGLGAFLL